MNNDLKETIKTEKLIGPSNEITVSVNGVECKALLDTGSTVTCISQDFFESHLSNVTIKSLDSILDIECADGNSLPYNGCVEISLAVSGLPNSEQITCVALVVPNSKYNSKVPVLLGTNVLSVFLDMCKDEYGEKLLQNADLFTPWFLSFRTMTIREKELKKRNNVLGYVKSAESKCVLIPPNTTKVLSGYIDKGLSYYTTCALIQPTNDSILTNDLDVWPNIITYTGQGKSLVDVHVSNITTRTVNVQPSSLLCELQPVELEHENNDIQSQWGGKERNDNNFSYIDEINIQQTDLKPYQTEELKDLILNYNDVFSKHENDIGHVTTVKHRIELTDERPFKQRYRRIPPHMYNEVREHLKQLLACGIIRPSHSPFSSPVVLARKKDGSLRMCVDYRGLNQRTIKDSYALPRIDDILDSLAGAKYFSVLDMKSGYYQVEIAEEHKERTAFTLGPLGFWEHNRLAFGLANSPACYQRLMENCFGELHLKICFIYLDDLIIFSNTYEEHIERLELIFLRLRQCGLKLSPKKCSFLQKEVKFIGHIVSAEGISTDPSKIEKVKNWVRPTNAEEVRRFVAFAGYYRRFVKDFSKIAKPLTAIMPSPVKKGKKKQSEKLKLQTFNWGSEQENAFNELKRLLCSHPILGYSDHTLPYELHVDASSKGLGAVLYQKQNGLNRVISYASRGLSKTESHYPAHKLEFLCLKWAVSEKFNEYLYGQKFTVFTDNNPLTYVLTTAKLDATGHRWLAALASFNFDLIYRPARNNADADGLSRQIDTTEQLSEHLSVDSVQAICHGIETQPYIETLCMSNEVIEQTDFGLGVEQLSVREIRQAQLKDPLIGYWMKQVRNKVKPTHIDGLKSNENLAMLRTFDKLKLVRGVLYREISVYDDIKVQLVLPSQYISSVLTSLHDDVGHPGRDRTLTTLRDRFYWPGMVADVTEWLKQCGRCVRFKTNLTARAPLVSIQTSQPLELVCMDFLQLEMSKGGFQYVLVITDHFTRYSQAIPTRNMTAKTTADAFINNFVVHYGLPERIHSDQGANFVGKLVQELCTLVGIAKSRTTPYHSMGNGQCEKFNKTLIDMLGTLNGKYKSDWKNHISPLVHAYNCIRNVSTGQSPFFLMFGRHPRLPVDLAFGIDLNKKVPASKYVKSLKERFEDAYDKARNCIKKAQDRQKSQYDTRIRGAKIMPGDRVLVKITAFDGRHKLADKWTEAIYIVTRQPNINIPVYDVHREDGKGKVRTLHRNLLLPIGSLNASGENNVTSELTVTTSTANTADSKRENDANAHKNNTTDRPIPRPRKLRQQIKTCDDRNPPHFNTNTGVNDTDGSDKIEPTSDDDDDLNYVYFPGTLSDVTTDVNVLGESIHDSHSDVSGEDAHVTEDLESTTSSVLPDDIDTNDAGVDADAVDNATASIYDNTDDTTVSEDRAEISTESTQLNTEDGGVDNEVTLRRSTRVKAKPKWFTSDQYVMFNQFPSQPQVEWKSRAEFLTSLVNKGILTDKEKYADAIVSLVTTFK